MQYHKSGEVVSVVLVLAAVAVVSGMLVGLRNGQTQTELRSRAQVPSPSISGPYPRTSISPTPVMPKGIVDVAISHTLSIPEGRAIIVKMCPDTNCDSSRIHVTNLLVGFGGEFNIGKNYYLTVEPYFVNAYTGETLEKIDGLSLTASGCTPSQIELTCPFIIEENKTTNISLSISFKPNPQLSPIPTLTPYPTYPPLPPTTIYPSQPAPISPTPYPTITRGELPNQLMAMCYGNIQSFIGGNDGAYLIWQGAVDTRSYYVQVNDLNDNNMYKVCPSLRTEGNGSFCTTVYDTNVKKDLSVQGILIDQSLSFQPVLGHTYNWSVQAIDDKGNRSAPVTGPSFTCIPPHEQVPMPISPGPIKPTYPRISRFPQPSMSPPAYITPALSPSVPPNETSIYGDISIRGDLSKVTYAIVSFLKQDQDGSMNEIDHQEWQNPTENTLFFKTNKVKSGAEYIVSAFICIDQNDGNPRCIPQTKSSCPGTIHPDFQYCTMNAPGKVKYAFDVPPSGGNIPVTPPSPSRYPTKYISQFPTQEPEIRITKPIKRPPTTKTPRPLPSPQPLSSAEPLLDVSGNGIVDVADYLIAMRNYGQSFSSGTSTDIVINAQFISRILSNLGRRIR